MPSVIYKNIPEPKKVKIISSLILSLPIAIPFLKIALSPPSVFLLKIPLGKLCKKLCIPFSDKGFNPDSPLAPTATLNNFL